MHRELIKISAQQVVLYFHINKIFRFLHQLAVAPRGRPCIENGYAQNSQRVAQAATPTKSHIGDGMVIKNSENQHKAVKSRERQQCLTAIIYMHVVAPVP